MNHKVSLLGFCVLSMALLGGAYAGSSVFHFCSKNSRFQCADIKVPLGRNPKAGETRVHVVMLPANNKLNRHHLLFANFGGPWASASSLYRWAPYLSKAILNQFTLVAVDPRGTGLNKLQCKTAYNQKILAVNLFSSDAANKLIALRQLKNKACWKQYQYDNVAYVGTRYTARDMDNVRKVFGATQLNYLGYSYGSKLGAVYLSLYPNHVRAMVLDGNMSPYNNFQQLVTGDARAISQTLYRFFKICRTTKYCAINKDPRDEYRRALRRINSGKIVGVTPSMFAHAVLDSLVFTGGKGATKLFPSSLWGQLAKSIDEINHHQNGKRIIKLFNLFTGSNDEKLRREKLVGDDSTYVAVVCQDYANHPSNKKIVSLVHELQQQYPLIGGADATRLATLCVGWPESAKPLAETHITAPHPILIVGNQSDPQTPLIWSKELVSQIKGSHLLIWSGAGHTAYMTNEPPNTCVRDYVNRYLLTLQLPKTGTVCRPFHNPFKL